ncbi:MAG: HAMP domain-containing histidine kinase [Dehalococcoidales bacterium]|nr:HAMP domain-containing histidine kinase [Dehalococcoidales bacterium]
MEKGLKKDYVAPEKNISSSHRISSSLKLREITNNLAERVKELNCLYGLSRLFENQALTIDEILHGVIDLVPPAWQYPDITCARIKLKNKEFKSADFQVTTWCQKQNIVVNQKRFGSIEVYYREKRTEFDEGPFLKEERSLLLVIAERLGHTIERKIAEDNVRLLYQRERKLRENLQDEIRTRVDFTRKLIHELKTPLTSLIATSQLLYDETNGEKYGKLAKYIWESAENFNRRIDELHDLVRGEIGTLRLNLKPVNIVYLLRSLTEETSALAKQCGMSIELDLGEKLPEVKADSDRLRQVILNLINNAFKYAKDGKRIIIKVEEKDDFVQVEVKDFGSGIPEVRHKTLFEPGYRSEYHEERSGGLGIGLALCRTLIELQGGEIWMESPEGRGATFFFTVPIVVK